MLLLTDGVLKIPARQVVLANGLSLTETVDGLPQINGPTGTASNGILDLQPTTTAAQRFVRLLDGGTPTEYNWIMGRGPNVTNGVEITPSTAVGGMTFSSPILTILRTAVSLSVPLQMSGVTALDTARNATLVNLTATGTLTLTPGAGVAAVSVTGGGAGTGSIQIGTGGGYFQKAAANPLDLSLVINAPSADATNTSRHSGRIGLSSARWTGTASANEYVYIANQRRSANAGDFYLDIGAGVNINGTLSFGGTGTFSLGSYIQSEAGAVNYRNLAYAFLGGTATGAIVIKTNIKKGVDSAMCSVRIKGYYYDATAPFDMTVGFYNYAGGPSFPNIGYTSTGSKRHQVRLGWDAAGNVCIILDDVASVNPYPRLQVAEAMIATGDVQATGWTISLVTDLSTYTGIVTVPDVTYLDATRLQGTIPDARLSSNVPLKNASNVFTGANFFETTQSWRVAGDTVARFITTNAGAMEWGTGGATARDTYIDRTGLGRLRVRNQLGMGIDPSRALHTFGNGGFLASQLTNVPAPTVAPQGTAGTTTYSYYVVAVDQVGFKTMATVTTIATGNATLDATNFNRITWATITGAVSYEVIRSTGGATQGRIATVTAPTVTFDDTGAAATAYTFPLRNTTADVIADGLVMSNLYGHGSAAALTANSLSAPQNGFGGYGLFTPELHDGLFAAMSRFAVTATYGTVNAFLFDGSFGGACANPAGTTNTITIDVTARGEGVSTYPDGFLYVSFYYTDTPAAVSLRCYRTDTGLWYAGGTAVNVAGTANMGVYRISMPSGNYFSKIELTVVARPTQQAQVIAIQWMRTRPAGEPVSAFIKGGANRLYGTTSWYDTGNNLKASVNAAGDATFASLSVAGAASVGTLGVSGVSTFSGQLRLNGNPGGLGPTVRYIGMGGDANLMYFNTPTAGGAFSFAVGEVTKVSVTNAGVLTAFAGVNVSAGDLTVGSLGTFDGTNASRSPQAGELLVWGRGNKWTSEAINFTFGSSDTKVSIGADNTTFSYISDATVAGVGTPSAPTTAPKLIIEHKAITVDVSDYVNSAAGTTAKGFNLQYAINDATFATPVTVFMTGRKFVHSRLTVGATYYYRYAAVGASASANGPAANAVAVSNSKVTAFGSIIAAEISVANLAAISADIGVISAGILQSAQTNPTSALRLTGGYALAATVKSFIDLSATGSGTFLRVSPDTTDANATLLVLADGTITMKGTLTGGLLQNAVTGPTAAIRLSSAFALPGSATNYLDLTAATSAAAFLKVGSLYTLYGDGSVVMSGTLTGGLLQNAATNPTAAIRLSSAFTLPATATTYFDLAFSGNSPFIQSVPLTVDATSAKVRGSITATSTLFAQGGVYVGTNTTVSGQNDYTKLNYGSTATIDGILRSGSFLIQNDLVNGLPAAWDYKEARRLSGDSFNGLRLFDVPVTGTVTASSTTTITDTNRKWGTNQFSNARARVWIMNGSTVVYDVPINSNTSTSLTFPAVATAPTVGWTYKIVNVFNAQLGTYTQYATDAVTKSGAPWSGTATANSANWSGGATVTTSANTGVAAAVNNQFAINFTLVLDGTTMSAGAVSRTGSITGWVTAALYTSTDGTTYGASPVYSKTVTQDLSSDGTAVVTGYTDSYTVSDTAAISGYTTALYLKWVVTSGTSNRTGLAAGTPAGQVQAGSYSWTQAGSSDHTRRNLRLFSFDSTTNFNPALTIEPVDIMPASTAGRRGDMIYVGGTVNQLFFHDGSVWQTTKANAPGTHGRGSHTEDLIPNSVPGTIDQGDFWFNTASTRFEGAPTSGVTKQVAWVGDTIAAANVSAGTFAGAFTFSSTLTASITGNASGSAGSLSGWSNPPTISTGGTWPHLLGVKSDGVTEIGKYLDFHNTSADGIDYAVRLETGGTTDRLFITVPGSQARIVTETAGPWGISVTGTASNITAFSINQSLSTTSSPTFANVIATTLTGNNASGSPSLKFSGGGNLDTWASAGGVFRWVNQAYGVAVLTLDSATGNLISQGTITGTAAAFTSGRFGSTTAVSNALASALASGNCIEFGHVNAAGYRSVLGAEASSGAPVLIFNGETGTSANTYRTRGVAASIFKSTNDGGFQWCTVGSANADNQSAIEKMKLTPAGQLIAQGGFFSPNAVGYYVYNVAGVPQSIVTMGNDNVMRFGDFTNSYNTRVSGYNLYLDTVGQVILSGSMYMGSNSAIYTQSGYLILNPSSHLYLRPGTSSQVLIADNAANTVRIADGGGDTFVGANLYVNTNNFGLGVVGRYDATKYRAVYAMGAGFTMATDGTGLGSLYGMFYAFDATSGGQNVTGQNFGHGMGIAQAGIAKGYIGANGIWTAGAMVVGSGVTAADFVLSSDVRLKQNLRPITSVLNRLDGVQAWTYELRAAPGRRRAGVIAQEILEVFPEAVTVDAEGYYAVSYDALIPYLLQAIKELRDEVRRG